MPPVRSKAAIVLIIYLTLFIFFYIVFRNEQVNGRLYDAKSNRCLGVLDDPLAPPRILGSHNTQLLVTQFPNKDCEIHEAQISLQTDGGETSIVYYAPLGPLCMTNIGDLAVAWKECTGEDPQKWHYGWHEGDQHLVARRAAGSPWLSPLLCLQSQAGLFNGGAKVGLKQCSDREAQVWKFTKDSSVFSF